MQLSDWKASKFYKTDATKKLFSCPHEVATENFDDLSLDAFIEKYESKNLPVLIKGKNNKIQGVPRIGKSRNIGISSTSTETIRM